MKNKYIGIVLIVFSILAYFYVSEKKSAYLVLKEHFTEKKQHFIYPELLEGNNYFMFFGAGAKQNKNTQTTEVNVLISIHEQNGDLIAQDEINAISNLKSGGLKQTENSFDFSYTAQKNTRLSIEITFLKGDYTHVEIYKNLPKYINLIPGLFIITGLFGLIIFVKGRKSNI